MDNDQEELFNTQEQFLEQCSECYILLEKYKLKTHLVGFNMQKQQIHYSNDYLQRRITQRYTELENRLLQGLKNLHKNFLMAKGNALRTVNNIFHNYRSRVGLISNDPLSTLKYNKYNAEEKLLLETMLFNDKDNKEQIQILKKTLQEDLEQSTKQINQKYKVNDRIKQNFNKAFQIVDKSQCYTYKYYQNFQRSMVLALSTWQANFDKLNAFLSIWENVGSIKAFEAKTKKQIQSQSKHRETEKKRYYEEETEEQLQQLMNNFLENSPVREEYAKRLADLRRNTNQRQNKLDNYGRMYNKRKNRPGILVNKHKDVVVIDYYENIDNQKKHFSTKDEFKLFKTTTQSEYSLSEYRLSHYQMQKPFRTTEQIKNHMQKSHRSQILNHQWHYDRFGRGNHQFNIITTFNQQIQKKLEFECIRQSEFIQKDDLRKREIMQKNTQIIKDIEKKQGVIIGLKRLSDKNQLQWLNQRIYTPQYIPQLIQSDGQELRFSSDQQEAPQKPDKQKQIVQVEPKPDQPVFERIVNLADEMQEEIKIEGLLKIRQIPIIQANKVHIDVQNDSTIKVAKQIKMKAIIEQSSSDEDDYDQQGQGQACLQKQIIQKYFREYSRKILRKQTNPDYKKTYFFYENHYSQIDHLTMAKYIDFENLFMVTHREVILINKIVSNQQKIKCYVYLIEQNGEEEREEPIRQLINKIYTNTILTVKFQEVYLEDSSRQNLSYFVVGLISILIKFNTMPEEFELQDYLIQGREIIEDFKIYFYPHQYELQKQKLTKKFKSFAPKDIFAPLKKKQKFSPSKQLEKQHPNSAMNYMQQTTTKEMQDGQKEEENSSKKAPLQQVAEHLNQNEQINANIDNSGDRILYHSNSRQKITSSDLQLQMTQLKTQEFQDKQEDDDYQAL